MSEFDDEPTFDGGGYDVDDWARLKPFTGALATLEDVQAKVASLVTYEQSVCSSAAAISAAASQSGSTQAWIMNIASAIVSILPGVLGLL